MLPGREITSGSSTPLANFIIADISSIMLPLPIGLLKWAKCAEGLLERFPVELASALI